MRAGKGKIINEAEKYIKFQSKQENNNLFK